MINITGGRPEVEVSGAPKLDLHTHSCFSDGVFSPSEVVERCKNAGIEVMSLTDHESVAGVSEAIIEGERLGVRVIPGIEFAADYLWREYHILGYFIDYTSEKLEDFFLKWRKTKIIQIRKMVEKLQNFGFIISFEDIMGQARGSVNRPHISWAIFRNPDNLRANLKVLERWGVVEQQDFFRKFLLEPPRGEGLAYENRERPQVREVIDLIQSVGGLAFWAHPFSKIKNIEVICDRAVTFGKFGLNGIETYYVFHNEARVLGLRQIAQELSLYESCGSDFHGIDAVRDVGNFKTFGLEVNFPMNR